MFPKCQTVGGQLTVESISRRFRRVEEWFLRGGLVHSLSWVFIFGFNFTVIKQILFRF